MMLDVSFYVFAGIIQGITEWLPLSSEGLVSLILSAMGGFSGEKVVQLALFLHAGTLLASVIYFRRDVGFVLRDFVHYNSKKGLDELTRFLVASTVMGALIGFLIYRFMFGYVYALHGKVLIGIIGVALLFTALLQRISKEDGPKKKLEVKDGVIIGAAQALALIPGISRSGITISGLLMRKYLGEEALRLSFLMSIPAVLGVIALMLVDGFVIKWVHIIALVCAFGSGYLTIDALIRLARRIRFWGFCVIVGVIAIIASLI